jgi:hypothetical protein
LLLLDGPSPAKPLLETMRAVCEAAGPNTGPEILRGWIEALDEEMDIQRNRHLSRAKPTTEEPASDEAAGTTTGSCLKDIPENPEEMSNLLVNALDNLETVIGTYRILAERYHDKYVGPGSDGKSKKG